MSEAKQLFMDVSLSVQKQSVDAVEALNTFRGPQGPQGSPGGIDNLMVNGKKPTIVEGMNTIDLTATDVGALPAGGTAANADKLNGKDAAYYLGARNLLDNSDFTNPVNQAGLGGKHGNTMYAVDRWVYNKNDASHLSLNSGLGLSFASGIGAVIYQRLAYADVTGGKTYTLALWTADGGHYVLVVQQHHSNVGTSGYTACHNSENVIYIQNVSATQPIKCVALYEGTYTSDNLPPYVAPDPVAELLKCQRYLVPVHKNATYQGYVSNSGNLLITVPVSVPMRSSDVLPTVSGDTTSTAYAFGSSKVVTNFTAYRDTGGGGVILRCAAEDANIGVNGYPVAAIPGTTFYLCKDL